MSDQKQFLDAPRRRMVKALKRRANFLQASISAGSDQTPGRSYDRAELAALEFAIATILEHYAPTDAGQHE